MIQNVKRVARTSGLLYLLMICCGMFSLVYVPSKLYVWESAIDTHKNIIVNEFFFKLGILSDLFMYTLFLFLSLSLHRLLKQVSIDIAVVMIVLVVVSVGVSYANLIPKLDIITLLDDSLGSYTAYATERSEQLFTILKSHYNGFRIIQIFWGLWLFPFGL